MKIDLLYIIISALVAIVIIGVVFIVVKKRTIKNLKNEVLKLEREKNIIEGTPITGELIKLDRMAKNEELRNLHKELEKRYSEIKEKELPIITDLIITTDTFIVEKNRKEAKESLTKLEMEIYKLRTSYNNLLDEIQNITESEERNRAIITKLKAKYRDLEKTFKDSKELYGDIYKYIDLQFENIEKKFQDFEFAMENNEFSEVTTIVKVLDEMIAHIEVIVNEVPDIILLIDTVIPARIKEVEDIYDKLIEKKYPLSYLKVIYNLEEINKKINKIVDNLKILNLEDSMFELKTFLEYLDNLFNEFEYEKRSRRLFEETSKNFKEKINKINKIVSDIYIQIDDIKGMYDLADDDLKNLEEINKKLLEINEKYNLIIRNIKEDKEPYSKCRKELDILSNKLQTLELELDLCLKNLGSMHDDEERAREQLDEITELLEKCKKKIASYNLPIISNNYFVELAEANEAIFEIIKELEKTPITIKTLNLRVDTARDLSLKLLKTTNEMMKTARLSEMIIVYGNRYKPLNQETNNKLDLATMLFFKGEYKKSLETSINAINIIEPDIYKKMLGVYKDEN